MEQKQRTILLRDKRIEPTASVLEDALGPALFGVYQQFTHTSSETFQLEAVWKYYNDGKAWLCKLSSGKKTICWLSVFPQMFQLSFFFTEKNRHQVMQLEIDPIIKQQFQEAKPIGKLIPLVIAVGQGEQLKDVEVIIAFKKQLK